MLLFATMPDDWFHTRIIEGEPAVQR